MKKISIGILALCLMGLSTSCEDFLTEKPQQDPNLEQYYKTASHARAGVNKLYDSGLPIFYDAGVYNGATIGWGAYLSGFFDNEYKGQEVIVQYSQDLSLSPANIAVQMNNLWRDTYRAIGRANTALKYVPGIEDPNFVQGEKDRLIAEAKFFRAVNYFHLLKTYGDVPLITEPYESLNNIYVSRTPSADVYTQVVKDLNDAIAVLPNQAFVNNQFRISKTTAETLLAAVYLQMSGFPLQQNRYADAAATARSIIKGGKHTLTANEDEDQRSAYNLIRTEDKLTEVIYSRERSADLPDHSARWTQLAFPVYAAGWGTFKYSLANNGFSVQPTIINAYDPANDLRIKERQFFFNEYIDKNGSMSKFQSPAPWFYLDEEAMFETGVSGRNFAIYRYAEVLLVAAEAIAQAEGVNAEAVGYLADVRARAYTKKTREELVSSLSALSKDAFVQEVWAERLREFSLEFKLWDDIQRTRKYPVTTEAAKGTVTFVNVVGAKNPWGATFQEKHLLWPISNQEMQRNPSLVQNPGY